MKTRDFLKRAETVCSIVSDRLNDIVKLDNAKILRIEEHIWQLRREAADRMMRMERYKNSSGQQLELYLRLEDVEESLQRASRAVSAISDAVMWAEKIL